MTLEEIYARRDAINASWSDEVRASRWMGNRSVPVDFEMSMVNQRELAHAFRYIQLDKRQH